MRLRMPREKVVVSDDGASQLYDKGVSSGRDGGGHYLLEMMWPEAKDGKLCAEAVVKTLNPSLIQKQTEDEGVDYWSLDFRVRAEIGKKYSEKYGSHDYVKSFWVYEDGLSDKQLIQIRDTFCELLFEFRASYALMKEDCDPVADKGKYYPGEIQFIPFETLIIPAKTNIQSAPFDGVKRLHKTFTTGVEAELA